MKINKLGRKTLTGLVAAGAAIALAFGGAAAANADPGANGPLILPGAGDNPITGTVTVHKHEQGDAAGTPADGLLQELSNPTIPGVEFTAQRVESFIHEGTEYNLDLTTNEGWQTASQLVYNAAKDSWSFNNEDVLPTFGTDVVRTTGPADGDYVDAVFADLPVGLYHFEETAYPSDVTPSAPWVMTVPLTHPKELNSWLYDIHVYPKNSTTSITKTVADAAGVKLGDAVTWTIKGDLPRTANPGFDSDEDASLTNLEFLAPTAYVIKDQLDPRLTLSSVAVSLINGSGDPITGAAELVADDYTVVPDPAEGAGANVSITFKTSGLEKLGLAGSTTGAQVQVIVGTSVNSVSTLPAVDGEIPGVISNQAILFPNQPSVDKDEGIPSDVPVTKWGDILIKKVDASNNTVNIEGAVFSVFESKAAAEAGNNPIVFPGGSAVTEFTTGPDGTVRISGLRQSGWADNQVQLPYLDASGGQTADIDEGVSDNPKYRTYWLVEVKSPTGYELLAEPIEVIVTAAGETVAVTQIENAPSNAGFELPLTGGMGTALFTILGVGILAAVLVVARRRQSVGASAE